MTKMFARSPLLFISLSDADFMLLRWADDSILSYDPYMPRFCVPGNTRALQLYVGNLVLAVFGRKLHISYRSCFIIYTRNRHSVSSALTVVEFPGLRGTSYLCTSLRICLFGPTPEVSHVLS